MAVPGASDPFSSTYFLSLVRSAPCSLVHLALNQDLQNLGGGCGGCPQRCPQHLQEPLFKKHFLGAFSPPHNKAQITVLSVLFNMNLSLFCSPGSLTYVVCFILDQRREAFAPNKKDFGFHRQERGTTAAHSPWPKYRLCWHSLPLDSQTFL